MEGKPNKPRKGNGYFLELEETEVPKELKAAAKSIASATNEVKAKASELVTAVTTKESESNAKAEPAKAEPAKAEPAKAEKVKTADAVAPAKAETAKAEAPAKKQPPKVEVELVQTAEGVKAQAVKPTKPVKEISDSNGKAASTFAPNYLMPSASNSRRRPGANMNSFLDMARQVKTPG
ncbi:hypothetical protein [Chroococcidiopsis sp. SAG 2025]|uniref:hypothetical protein n=1 Tax=Chroococcidiopsis sp. SAG 2025 TaxID=171389 RepID=UPI0029371752|nr:hypothetical protein [Chroococcidiopsis sp. SAG 2025]